MSFVACGCETSWIQTGFTDVCYGSRYVAFMTIVDWFIRYACNISDPCGRVVPKLQPRQEYDFIVIGSGTGGSTIAGRLAEQKGWTTLLLEAGMDEPPASQVPMRIFTNTDIDWNYKTEPSTIACLGMNGACPWPRGKVLGGTSVLNGMMYMRPTRADFQRWVDAGNTEWSYDSLLPVFKASEDNKQIGNIASEKHHGVGGPFTVQQFNYHPPLADDILLAAKQLGYPVSNDLAGDVEVGFSIAQASYRDGARLSTAKAFVRPHKNASNFDVMINSTATKILVSGEGANKKATGVQFIYNGKTYTVNAKKEVILAAGAIATPQLLLLSGIGDKKHLDEVGIKQVHNLTSVGKGLQNHVAFQLSATINITNFPEMNYETLEEYIKSGGGPLSGTGLQQVTARLSSNYTKPDDPDIQLFFQGMNNLCSTDGRPETPDDPTKPSAIKQIMISAVNLHTKSTGYIALASNDSVKYPKIYANYLSEKDDVKILIAGVKLILQMFSSPLLKEKYDLTFTNSTFGDCGKYVWGTDDFWECAIRYNTDPENHQGSSCKMGPSTNPEACVDQQLRLHGIPNLRVTDASVFATLPSGNTQALIVAIAERAYQNIKKDYL